MTVTDEDIDDCPADFVKSASALLRDFSTRLDTLLSSPDDASANEVSSLIAIIEPFQSSPQLIDPILEKTIDQICESFLQSGNPWKSKVVYTLIKIRSAKVVSKFLPNDVALLEVILKKVENSKEEHAIWEERFFLLLWLSVLVLTPFKLTSLSTTNTAERIYNISLEYLKSSGRDRESAASLVANFLARTDMLETYLSRFVNESQTNASKSVFAALGTVSALARLFNICSAQELAAHLNTIGEFISSFKSQHSANNHLRKLLCKMTYRHALCCLTLSTTEIPTEVEVCLEELISTQLSDKDTMVRYSASKAFSRVVKGIEPLNDGEFVPEIIDGLFQFSFSSKTDSDKWHGGLLAIAEVLRQHGLPLPNYADKLTNVITEGLKFEVRKTTHAIGANVRDAACYVAWSLFRHYPKLCDKPTTKRLARTTLAQLTIVSSFDREINNRRAASAAIQECVGRHADVIGDLETGINLIQTVDYFAVGNRANAYLVIAPQVRKFNVCLGMIEHLLDNTIISWDIEVRKLGAQALALLSTDEGRIVEVVDILLSLIQRSSEGKFASDIHGYVYALGELLDASISNNIKLESVSRLVELFDSIEFSTYHAELLQDAAIHVIGPAITIFVSAKFTVPKKYLDILYDVLYRTGDEASIATLHEAACSVVSRLPESLIDYDEWTEKALENTGHPGFLLALGSVKPSVTEEIINLLCKIASSQQEHYDIALRIASIKALGKALDSDSMRNLPELSRAILAGLQDYTIIPSRGDVGLHCRNAAMKAVSQHANVIVPGLYKLDIISALIRIALERIDKLRREAFATLLVVLKKITIENQDTRLANVFENAPVEISHDLLEYFYHLLEISALYDNAYARASVLGIVSCIGGNGAGESAVRASRAAVTKFSQTGKGKILLQNAIDMFVDKNVIAEDAISPPKRDFELAELIALLFDNVNDRTVVSSTEVQLYNKTAKLFAMAIKSRARARLEVTINVFTGLITTSVAKVRKASLQKLVGLLRSDFKQVRQPAADALFLLASQFENAEVEELLSVHDWTTVDAQHADVIESEKAISTALSKTIEEPNLNA
ncbi:armadillo-type protein [Lipomyces japonicus]|uniref:armadillo-type protein n=1 Tax=Lipomyces japonicus TaxID=56871 RepID=UPI0034CDD4FB